MRVEVVTAPGESGRRNEDYAAVAKGVAVVLDGVIPPPDGATGCRHDVPWFVGHLGAALLDLAVGGRDLTDCLATAIRRTASLHDDCDLTHRRTPQTTVVVARWDAERIEYLVLSDSILLLASPDGDVTPIVDSRLDDLRAPRKPLGPLRNVPGGFHTAAADPSVAGLAVTGSVPLSQVHAVALLTDGAARWTEVFGRGTFAELFALVRDKGPQALVDEVRMLEDADPDCSGFPRGKAHDDATVVLVEF
jgi:hypothetical protein